MNCVYRGPVCASCDYSKPSPSSVENSSSLKSTSGAKNFGERCEVKDIHIRISNWPSVLGAQHPEIWHVWSMHPEGGGGQAKSNFTLGCWLSSHSLMSLFDTHFIDEENSGSEKLNFLLRASIIKTSQQWVGWEVFIVTTAVFFTLYRHALRRKCDYYEFFISLTSLESVVRGSQMITHGLALP